jgi:YfiH family protein
MKARWLMTERNAPVAGVSSGAHQAWASLNLGGHVGDSPEAVAENRGRLGAHLRAQGGLNVHYLHQVHGTDVTALDRLDLAPGAAVPSADAAWTSQPGPVCTVLVADCLPVLLQACDDRGDAVAVAAAHAGWRGLAAGVLESTMAAVTQGLNAAPAHWRAWLGPCIGPQAFEVGDEVRQAFVDAQGPAAAQAFRLHPVAQGKWLANLPQLARERLASLGLSLTEIGGNDASPAWCTVSNPSRFFSHRRDAARLGTSGRMAACIWLVP